jgi:peptidoglycan/LPS O-acetylase OafA/YrhL
VSAPSPRRHYPLFDSLRAVAALMVLAYHVGLASGVSGGYAWGRWTAQLNSGVAVFFVISGFLLHRPFVASRLAGVPAPGAAGYARRRALRILPGYWVALTALALFPGLPGVLGGDWWRYYGFAQVYARDTQFSGLSPAWSLCVEVSFYALLPVYALVLRRALRGRPWRRQVRVELALLGAVAVGTLLARHVAVAGIAGVGPHPAINFTLLGTADWFALGMGIAVLSAALDLGGGVRGFGGRLVGVVERRPLLVWGTGIGLFAITAWPRSNPLEVHHVAAGLLGACLVLPAVFGDGMGGLPRRLLAHRKVAWLGLVSYGIFLWHEPLTDWFWRHGIGRLGPGPLGFAALLAAITAVGILLGAASYSLVERRAVRMRIRRRARIEPRPSPATR